jgi:hypothetical protein|tara:strand:+ start:2288 stop:2809 length:522 start_codon:yes stop_codon:yes gene_type:complete
MGRTTFSGPLRVGQAQKTENAQVAGAVSLVATGHIADPTAASTTAVTRNSDASGNGTLPLILPARAIVTKLEVQGGATGGTNPTYDLGWIGVNDATEFDVDGLVADGDADGAKVNLSFGDGTTGDDFGFEMSTTQPVKITGGVGDSAPTGGSITFRVHYHVFDDLVGGDGSAA